jgi:hypothetical protein
MASAHLYVFAARIAREALMHDAVICRYHGFDLEATGMQRGLPRCDSCKQPYRVRKALAAIRVAEGETAGELS